MELAWICSQLGIEPEQVLGHAVYDHRVVVVVDYGIAGGKKRVLELDAAPELEPETEPELAQMIDATESAVALAEELGIDLRRVQGTGSGGRIIKSDVARAGAGGEA